MPEGPEVPSGSVPHQLHIPAAAPTPLEQGSGRHSRLPTAQHLGLPSSTQDGHNTASDSSLDKPWADPQIPLHHLPACPGSAAEDGWLNQLLHAQHESGTRHDHPPFSRGQVQACQATHQDNSQHADASTLWPDASAMDMSSWLRPSQGLLGLGLAEQVDHMSRAVMAAEPCPSQNFPRMAPNSAPGFIDPDGSWVPPVLPFTQVLPGIPCLGPAPWPDRASLPSGSCVGTSAACDISSHDSCRPSLDEAACRSGEQLSSPAQSVSIAGRLPPDLPAGTQPRQHHHQSHEALARLSTGALPHAAAGLMNQPVKVQHSESAWLPPEHSQPAEPDSASPATETQLRTGKKRLHSSSSGGASSGDSQSQGISKRLDPAVKQSSADMAASSSGGLLFRKFRADARVGHMLLLDPNKEY